MKKRGDISFRVRAHWGGRECSRYLRKIRELGIQDTIEVNGFIPHWRIPEFVRSCDAVFFLENRFSITFHQPSVPLEIISCGRPVITTEEIVAKPLYDTLLVEGENAFVVRGEVTGETIALAIRSSWEKLNSHCEIPTAPKLTNSGVRHRIAMYRLIEKIKRAISRKEKVCEV